MKSSSQDGGWGLVVVAGAFVAQMLSDGISYGFGILYVDLMETFQGTSAEISSIGSLSYGSFCFTGPVAGILTNRFGYRFVTIVGAFLEALGVFLSAFTPNLQFLYFSVGILIGVGGGMMYIASFVCVSTYFLSKRPLATSISSCGSSAGTFIFGFLYRVCIDDYGWRGALLVFSGLMLNGVVCGALFRPFSDNTSMDFELTGNIDYCETDQMMCSRKTVSEIESQYLTDETDKSCNSDSINEHLDPGSANHFINEHLNPRSASHSISEKLNPRSPSHSINEQLNPRSHSQYDASHLDLHQNTNSQDNKCTYDIIKSTGRDEIPEKRARDDISDSSSVDNTRLAAEKDHLLSDYEHRKMIDGSVVEKTETCPNNACVISAMKSDPQIVDKTWNENTETVERNSKENMLSSTRKQTSKMGSMVKAVLGTTNLDIFRDLRFVLFGLSTFLYCFGYGIPFVLLPDMAELNGFTPTEAAWVISEFGIAAIVGKFVFGALSQVLTNKASHANTKLNSYSVILSGIAIACAPWTYSYHVLLIIGAAFGLLSAAVNTLVTLVLIELLGAEKLADAFGWLNFFGGVGYVSGPVVAGWLYDVTAAYVATFIAAGCSLILAGIVLFPIFMTDSFRTVK